MGADHQLIVPVVQREAYTLSLERGTKEHTFVHCTVHGKWTKATKRQLQHDFDILRWLHRDPLYTIFNPEDRKHEKFISMFGFRFTLEYVDALSGRLTHLYTA